MLCTFSSYATTFSWGMLVGYLAGLTTTVTICLMARRNKKGST